MKTPSDQSRDIRQLTYPQQNHPHQHSTPSLSNVSSLERPKESIFFPVSLPHISHSARNQTDSPIAWQSPSGEDPNESRDVKAFVRFL
jgi:hypothetical protein